MRTPFRYTAVFAAFVLTLLPLSAGAVSASSWKPGNIINDKIFVDDTSMTVSQIQSWLNVRLKNCDYYGKKASELAGGIDYNGNGVVSRAEYGKTKGNPAPFTCLNKYYEVPKTTPKPGVPASNYGKSTVPSGSKSAARLIYDAARAYNISPKVLLVKLGTESAGPLTSDTWPFKNQYRYAMGAHCPDSGPGGSANCDSDYAGFSLQMREAAKLLRWYLDSMTQSWWSYKKPYTNNYIQWTVASSCGGKNVYIANKATAALYTYTPYQPNSASLSSYPGTGNSCSSYGNRNFWYVYNDWFGSTQSNIVFKNMENSRWLKLTEDAQKVEPFTETALGSVLASNKWIYFDEKITIDGKTYLRTEYDSDRKLEKAITLDKLSEVSVDFTPAQTPRWMKTSKKLYKIDPLTKKQTGGVIAADTTLYFSTKTSTPDTLYIRTAYDASNNNQAGIDIDDLLDTDLSYQSFQLPRWLITTQSTRVYDLTYPAGSSSPTIAPNTILFLDQKTALNGRTFALEGLPSNGVYSGIPMDNLRNIESRDFQPLASERSYTVTKPTQKIDFATGQISGGTLPTGTPVYFKNQITIEGTLYLQSAYDAMNGLAIGIPATDVTPVDVNFEDMTNPRSLKLRNDLRKQDPVTFWMIDGLLNKGQVISFDKKVTIDGTVYLRSSFDTLHNAYKVIPLSALAKP